MHSRNKTSLRDCRFLTEADFLKLYAAFIQAFSDYVMPFALTEAQFRNHIILNAVDLNLTIGCTEGEKLIGFSLNGFGTWNGLATVYDAGTGVIPECRRQGVSRKMFDTMLPIFKEQGIRQCLLEVVTSNTAAINLYENLEFKKVRELALLQCSEKPIWSDEKPPGVEIRPLADLDWGLVCSFWDGAPSWQNSVEAVTRSTKMKRTLGAFLDGRCIGYIVYSGKFGRVAQLAVSKDHRNQGIGTAFLRVMQSETAAGHSLQVINIDKLIPSAMDFFHNRGFTEVLAQYEMIKRL